MSAQTDHAEREALRQLSAAIGADRLRTQAGGGNTSIKLDDVLWIKASGCWLAEALEREIMVPVDLPRLRAALAEGRPETEQGALFTLAGLNESGLRPSIETTVHAVLPQRVVAHIHCVETIAWAVQTDFADSVALRIERLGLSFAAIPYRRPGLPLAQAIMAAPVADVLVLQNHGLVVAGDSVAEVSDRLDAVCAALAVQPRTTEPAATQDLVRAATGSGYRLPVSDEAHALALDTVSLALARGGSLYPDHVIFLGPGVVIAETIADGRAQRPFPGQDRPPTMLVLPGQGVLLDAEAGISADALALCLADVLARVPEGANLTRLDAAQEDALLNWEAEAYRQAMARKAAQA
jgi:rhamnose utilization protein RhaD (predicted bifunctional aldolase and dehydrogenase)